MRSSLHTFASFMTWGGTVAATVCLTLRYSSPAPRWDVLACVAVSVVGLFGQLRSRRSQYRAALQSPWTSVVPRPGGIRIVEPWRLADNSFRAAALFATAIVPLFVSATWAATAVGGTADRRAALAGGLLIGGVVVFWSFLFRVARRAEAGKAVSVVENASRAGVARALPVVIRGVGAGVHAPHPMSAYLEFDAGDRYMNRPRRRVHDKRIPRPAAALRLDGGGGERVLFLERLAEAQQLVDALGGRQAWLHWAPIGMPHPNWSAPAVLALGDGRYIFGWTPEAVEAGVPDGEMSGGAPSQYVQQLHPVESAVLLRNSGLWPGLLFHCAALALASTALLGIWGDAATGPLLASPALILGGFVSDSVRRNLSLKRQASAFAASGNAPSVLAPRSATSVPRPPQPPPPLP